MTAASIKNAIESSSALVADLESLKYDIKQETKCKPLLDYVDSIRKELPYEDVVKRLKRVVRIIDSDYSSLYDKFSANNWSTGVNKLESLLKEDKIRNLDELLTSFNNKYEDFLKTADYCSECDSYSYFVVSNGFDTCRDCGAQYEKQIVEDERRTFTISEITARKQNSPVPKHSFGARTVISNKNYDSRGKQLPPAVLAQRKRFIKTISRMGGTKCSSYKKMYVDIDAINSNYFSYVENKHVIDDAYRIFDASRKKKLLKGSSYNLFWVASVYSSMKKNGYPMLLNFFSDIVKDLRINESMISHTYELMDNRGVFEKLSYKMKPLVIPWDEIASRAHLSNSDKKILVSFHDKVSAELGNKIVSKAPSSIIAAELYLISQYSVSKLTQRGVSKLMHITEVTVRNLKKLIEDNINLKTVISELRTGVYD
jgi:transcription initiation factor TFIIIB Brf1 subunit/transcription initiation factor TFIIB